MTVTVGVVAAIIVAKLALMGMDRSSDNPKFKTDKHVEWNDPSKADN